MNITHLLGDSKSPSHHPVLVQAPGFQVKRLNNLIFLHFSPDFASTVVLAPYIDPLARRRSLVYSLWIPSG
jgi:hypothetical protein